MARIKVSSAKAKGRKLQQTVAAMIADCLNIRSGKDELIESREMGQSGTDVKLYGEALERFPYAIECKWQETWSLPAWIKQAKENTSDKMPHWLLFVKKNRHEEVVILDAEHFFELMNVVDNDLARASYPSRRIK